MGLLSILLEENLGKPVNKAMVIFSKKSTIKKIIAIDEEMRKLALDQLENTRRNINYGKRTISKLQ